MGRWRSAVDRKSTRLNSSHQIISYAVFCLNLSPSASSPLSLHDALPICRWCVRPIRDHRTLRLSLPLKSARMIGNEIAVEPVMLDELMENSPIERGIPAWPNG